MFRTFQELVKYLSQSIFKNLVKTSSKGKGITEINPALKFKAEKMAENAAEVLQKNNRISFQSLTKSDVDGLADNIVNPLKNAKQVPVKSADILPFRFKRSFAEELADASKKGDFNRMTGIMKVDPKFKEVMKNVEKQKATEKLIRERNLQTKRIPLDTMKYDTPEIAKLKGTERMNYLITSPEQTAKLLKKGVTSDDIIYAQDRYGMTAKDMVDSVDAGFKFPFAGGGVAGLLGERPGFKGGYLASGAKELGKKYKGSTLSAILENPKLLGAELGHDGIMELMRLLPSLFADGGPARQNFGMGKRAFLKLMGGVGAGIAGLKSGLFGLSKGGAKKAVTETVKSAGSGTPPPYFFKLVEKIKTLGDDAPKFATKDREVVTKYKDYTLTEDVATGEKTIQRMKVDDNLKYDASEYYGKPVTEDVYMNYKPGKGQADETMKGKTPPDEYIEDTSLIRTDKPARGEIEETFDGVPDDVLKEIEAGSGNVPESFYTGPNAIKKADGGRIGFKFGSKGILQFLKNLKVKPSGDDVKDFVPEPDTIYGVGGKKIKLKDLRKKHNLDKESLKKSKDALDIKLQEILAKSSTKHADGGLANMLGE